MRVRGRRAAIFWSGALGLLLLANAAPIRSHTAESAPEPAAAAEPETQPIPVSAIAMEASTLETRLHVASEKLEPSPEQKKIADELDAMAEDVHRRVRRLEDQLARSYTHSDLDELQSAWRNSRHDLEAWQTALRSRLDEMDKLNSELSDRLEVWKKTAIESREQSAPAEVRNQIASARKAIEAIQRRLLPSRDKTLGLQKRVVELSALVSTQLDRLDAAQEEVLTRLAVTDAPPLWAIELGNAQESLSNMKAAFGESVEALQHYADRNPSLLVLHGFSIVGLIWLCVRARRVSRDNASPPGSESIPPALRHPWAAGLVLGLSGGIWIHPYPPPELGHILSFVVLPWWVLVLRDLLPKSLRRPVMGLVVLVLLDLVRRILQDFSVITRILLVLELGALAAGLIWLRRPQRMAEVPQPRNLFWVRALGVWLHLSLLAAVLSCAAAIFGWVNLAELVGSAIVYSTFVGSILLTGARLVEDLAECFTRAGRLGAFRITRHDRDTFVRLVRHATRAVAFGTWVMLTLNALAIQAPALEALSALLKAPVGYANVNVTLSGICAFGISLWLSYVLSRLVALILDREVFTRVSLPRGVPFALTTMTRYAILVLGFIIAVAALGFEVGNLTLIVSALGVGIGFGMQNTVNNFLSGLMLLFERPIKVGDLLQVEEILGNVTHIGIRASRIRTFDGADVIVPNGDLISGRVVNWTLADKRRRVILPVGVAYGTDAKRVIEVLQEVAESHPEVLETPAPYVLFKGFGDSALEFEIRVWTLSDDALTLVHSEIAVETQAALARAGIEVPFPQRDLHLKSVAPAAQESLNRPPSRPE